MTLTEVNAKGRIIEQVQILYTEKGELKIELLFFGNAITAKRVEAAAAAIEQQQLHHPRAAELRETV